jgi:glycosyltransferase involved in cell wall biosynthesis
MYAQGIRATLTELMRQGGIDVVHAHCAYPDCVGAAWIAAQLRLPFVMTAHGSDINVYGERATIRPQLRWAMRHAESVVGVSRQICEKLAAIAPDRRDRIEQIPCAGVDPAVFAPRDRAAARAQWGVDVSARIVAFVGQLVPIKNPSVLVKAWQRLLAQGVVGPRDRLIFIGEGPLRQGLERDVAAPHFGDTVRFLGPLPQPQIAQWLSASDLLCLPSRNEGMPNVIVEALACGVPVVATAVGGIPDLITPTLNGLLVPADDASRLTDALTEALSQKWDAAQIAATVSGYTWAALATKNLQVLARATAR